MKIVINTCFGGFALSRKAYEFMGEKWDGYGFKFDDKRTYDKLIQCVQQLGESANRNCSSLKVVEIPDGIDWVIDNYHGIESIEEVHRSWS